MAQVTIIGAGIGGLTLALLLHRAGIAAEIFEATSEVRPLGVGINILPQASAILCGDLGLEDGLTAKAVLTCEAAFFNRFGQRIYAEPLGRAGGNAWPQFSIHRADLHSVLLDAVHARLGTGRLHLGWRCTAVADGENDATADFCDGQTGARPRRCAAKPSSVAMAFTPSSASNSIPARVNRSTQASICGAASRVGRRF